MTSREKAVAEIWTIYATFVITFFLFILMIQMAKPAEKTVASVMIAALGIAAISSVAIGTTLRKKFLDGAAERLRGDPQDARGLHLWRTGNILSFTIAESAMLLGVALKFLGARWTVSGVFFAFGAILMALWMPRVDIYPSTVPPAKPPPPPIS